MNFSDLSYEYNTALMSGNKRKAKKLMIKILRLVLPALSAKAAMKAKQSAVKKTLQFQKGF